MTWNRFKEIIFETYFPERSKSQLEVQFLELKQGTMTVAEYAAKFNELSRFAPYQVSTDERKAKRFKQGLKPQLYSRVSLFQLKTFEAVMEKAVLVEGGDEVLTKFNQEQKKKKNEAEIKNGGGQWWKQQQQQQQFEEEVEWENGCWKPAG